MLLWHGTKGVFALAIALGMTMLSGCIKGTSTTLVEEVELCGATHLTITNPLGNVKIAGADYNNWDGVVVVATEKFVDTYSLFGLATPDEYLDSVIATPTIENGVIQMNAQVNARNLLDRLLVRIVPHVNRIVEAPTLVSTEVAINIGDLELRNLPADVKASVSVGKAVVDSPIGVLGKQEFEVNVGELEMLLPDDSCFQYELAVDMGSIEDKDFALDVQRRLMGVRASGLAGSQQTPGLIGATVNIGTIAIKTP
jgi:hypothetical protein